MPRHVGPPRRSVAYVLSGGGAKGDFEVGAVRYLYQRLGPPDALAGTSVGAINAALLAQGGQDPVGRLEALWTSLRSDSDMWRDADWLANLEDDALHIVADALLDLGAIASPVSPLTPLALFGGNAVTEAKGLWSEIKNAKSLKTLEPIAERLQKVLNWKAVATAGIRLRLATVGINSGRLRFVDEFGRFTDGDKEHIGLQDGVMASASIPVVFPGVERYGETYYDGGLRAVAPVAAESGMDEIYVISAAPINQPGPFIRDTPVYLADLVRRATDLLLTEMTMHELTPPYEGAAGHITVIAPRFEVHDTMTIDPALIQIAMSYGFMCAYDTIEAWGGWSRAQLAAAADHITRLRVRAAELERRANGVPMPYLAPLPPAWWPGSGWPGSWPRIDIPTPPPPSPTQRADWLREARQCKRYIAAEARTRLARSTASVPAGFDRWWREWEAMGEYKPVAPTPWDAVAQWKLAAEPPPEVDLRQAPRDAALPLLLL